MEEKKIFDPKFVHFMWDDSLEGKVGFFSDCIDTLITRVDDNIRETIDKQQVFGPCTHGVNAYPFSIKDVSHRFFYYDSLYKYKLAYKQGKKVEVYGFVGISRAWIEVTEAWKGVPEASKWDENYEYRVKPEKKWRPFKDIVELKHAWNFKRGPMVHSDIDEPEIWVRDKKRPDITRLITGFNGGCNCVALAGEWHILEGLFDNYEFLDGTPCGVEE